jgi:hypothetical protein
MFTNKGRREIQMRMNRIIASVAQAIREEINTPTIDDALFEAVRFPLIRRNIDKHEYDYQEDL